MKILKSLIWVGMLWQTAAHAALYYSWSGSVTIPDNNPTGYAFTFDISDPNTYITDVTVSFKISGGYNGDLYGYLSHGSGFIVLLNRVGTGSGSEPTYSFGYSNPGFNVTLSDAGTYAIHLYQNHNPTYNENGQLTGTWRPNDGSATFGGTGGVFTGLDPNGTWTLFFADLSGGDVSTISGFSINITAVPEPINTALLVVGLMAGGKAAVRWLRTRAAGKKEVCSG